VQSNMYTILKADGEEKEKAAQESVKKKCKQGEVTFGELTDKNIKQLKILNITCLPVSYPEKFYTGLLQKAELTKYAFFNDILAGAICSRIEKDKDTGEVKLYIMTLAVLLPYRRLGIGTKLLDFVLEYAKKRPDIKAVSLNVQTNNETAISFYKHFGFIITKEEQNYYKKIDPPHAFFLTKRLDVVDK